MILGFPIETCLGSFAFQNNIWRMPMNSYFQIIIQENETGIKIFHATDGGEPVTIREVTYYLNREKISFPIKELNDALHANEDETYLKLSDESHLPIAESAQVIISKDRMGASIRFYPPSSNGKVYRKEDIYSELRVAKVNYGIDDTMVETLFQKREYCKDYPIAAGKPVLEGHDAKIIYHFETDNKIRPTLREDGSVDFFNLNVLNLCKAGDVLAELIPEDRGEAGIDVCGNVLKPRDVKPQNLSYGLNIDLSEDKLKLISAVNGHVSLVDGKIFVADMLEVNNVDNSTGNIEYEGNVVIRGDVCANFSIKAHGNVEVMGVVEGANIEADGNIILARGMNGMSKGYLKAGGNVIAKYLENCSVSCKGYVETESILHSVVEAGTEVNVVSRKGFISGGYVSAANVVRVRTLGTNMGADSSIVVGIDPSMLSQLNELTGKNMEIQKKLKQMLPVIEASKKKLASGVKLLPDQIKSLQQLAATAKQMQTDIVSNQAEIESIKELLDSSTDARVEISGEVYPGTKITISGVSMMVKNSMKYCAFRKKEGEIEISSL